MQYEAVFIDWDENNEEKINVEINGCEFTLFASCQLVLRKGFKYLVEIELFFIDEDFIPEECEPQKIMHHIDNGFKYEIYGKLDGSKIHSTLSFDEDFFWEFQHLSGKYVKFTVDRLDAEFIKSL